MSGLLAFVMALFLCLNILFQFMQGDTTGLGGSTRLTAPLSLTEVGTALVASTTDFNSSGYFIAGSERINYASKTSTSFLTLTRAQTWHGDDTEANSYSTGARLYDETAYALNAASGNQIISTTTLLGVTIPFFSIKFFTVTAPQMVIWDYPSIFDGPAGIIRSVFLYPLSAAFMLGMISIVVGAITGLLSRIFGG